MKPTVTKLELIRDKQQFQAYVALLNGELAALSLNLEDLHPNEKAVYQQYQYNRRKESYLLGRLSAKEAILPLTNISSPKSIWIDTGVFQFPIVKCPNNSNIQVSISHCDTIGFSVAYPEAHPMGIDVEKIHADRTTTLLSQLTQKEQLLLTKKNNSTIANYTALFSIKEALSKVIRTGMMLDFKFLEVDAVNINQQVIACTFTHFGQYKAYAYLSEEYVFSIVLPKRTQVNLEQLWKMIAQMTLVTQN